MQLNSLTDPHTMARNDIQGWNGVIAFSVCWYRLHLSACNIPFLTPRAKCQDYILRFGGSESEHFQAQGKVVHWDKLTHQLLPGEFSPFRAATSVSTVTSPPTFTTAFVLYVKKNCTPCCLFLHLGCNSSKAPESYPCINT